MISRIKVEKITNQLNIAMCNNKKLNLQFFHAYTAFNMKTHSKSKCLTEVSEIKKHQIVKNNTLTQLNIS